MVKVFNVTADCKPDKHYMVNLDKKLVAIKKLVDEGAYFTINRARQYGKTTTLRALNRFLQKDYYVVLMDFQTFGSEEFVDENTFALSFARLFLRALKRNQLADLNDLLGMIKNLEKEVKTAQSNFRLQRLFECLSDICASSDKTIVLMIDEVDNTVNNQVFIDFLAQLRAYYIDRDMQATFQSVILAGVHDVRSVKRKIRPEENHQENSPWNIAARFSVDMSFSPEEIAGMLEIYEADYHTGMNIKEIAELIYDYTSGYPYLVSSLCKNIDEEVTGSKNFPDKSRAWTKEGFFEAEKMLVKEDNTLYQSLIRKLKLYPELRAMLYELLFTGKPIPYVATNDYIKDAAMFGFIKNENETAVMSNRIFETVLYNYFISEEFAVSKMYSAGVQEKNQFIIGGHLDVRRVLEKFVETFNYLYGDQDVTFLEDVGRRYFLLFLKPIINGVGNYSIESQTRNNERMDLVIYYHGEQHIIELKLWRGNSYNERGEKQISDYLDYFGLKKGYMLSFNFNKKKDIGVKEIKVGDKTLIEAVV